MILSENKSKGLDMMFSLLKLVFVTSAALAATDGAESFEKPVEMERLARSLKKEYGSLQKTMSSRTTALFLDARNSEKDSQPSGVQRLPAQKR